MIVNFLIDSRFGGPQMILNHLKKKINKNKTIYFDKNNKKIFFSNLKKKIKIFFIIDIIFNLLSLLINQKYFKNDKIFFVYSIFNLVPVILGIILRKKVVWYILEKPNFIFYFIFKVLNLVSKIEIVCISESLAKMLKIKQYYIYFPTINLKYWTKKIYAKINSGNKFINIVCVGNLNKTKNHIQLIEFLEHSKKRYKLIIIGKKLETQKSYYHKLNLIKKKINYNGINQITIFQNKKQKFVKKILHNSDLFILPSLHEGLSIALVEAMSMKILCFVSRPSNHSKIIIKNKNGYEFNLNKRSFLSVFNKIYDLNSAKREKITLKARHTIEKLIIKNIIFEKRLIDMLLSNHQ